VISSISLLVLISVFVIGCKEEDLCGDFARSLIPDNLTMYNVEEDAYCTVTSANFNPNKWNDGLFTP